MRKFVIEDRTITQDANAFVVAEIGHNHGGSLSTALVMCTMAHECGCDAVKFQKRTIDKIFTKTMLRQPYHSEHAFGATYGEHRYALEFKEADYEVIVQHCAKIGILCFATAFDIDAADMCERLGMPIIKIASGDLTNTPLIEYVAQKRIPMILSTLGARPVDIVRADNILKEHRCEAAFLHCTPYKTKPHEVNLRAILRLKLDFPERIIGFSSHFNGPRAAADAYYMGARIMEQHFTYDRTAKGSDHAMSLEPSGMRELVNDVRLARTMQGTPFPERTEADEHALSKMEKCLYPVRTLPQGHRLRTKDIVAKSATKPDGLRPYNIYTILGKELVRKESTAEPLTQESIKDPSDD